jgi:hypothetical protein
MVWTGRFELEPICGRERGKAERESAGEILSEATAESKDLTLTPATRARFYLRACATLRRIDLGVLRGFGSNTLLPISTLFI